MVKILFCGSDKFAVPALEKLLSIEAVQVIGIITQPDRKVGRKQILTATDVGQFFNANLLTKKEIELFQPESLKVAAAEILANTEPDLILVAAYGKMIPQSMLDFPRFGCLNIHGSLLPTYRGAVPIEMAILNGDKEIGVSLIKMTTGLDEGDVIAEQSIPVLTSDDAITLRTKLATIGAELLGRLIDDLALGNLDQLNKAIPQTELSKKFNRVESFCSKADVSREKLQIFATDDAEHALRKIKAFTGLGAAWLKIVLSNGQTSELKIFGAEVYTNEGFSAVDRTIQKEGKELILILNSKKLKLTKIQLAGKAVGSATDYLFLAGTKLKD